MNKFRVSLVSVLFMAIALLPACQSDSGKLFEADQYVKYGQAALQKKEPNIPQAMKQFKNALDADPDHFEALIGYGDAHMYRALSLYYKDAEEGANQTDNGGGTEGESSGPSNKGASSGQGANQKKDKKVVTLMRRAWQSYQKAKEVRPSSPVPYYHMGRFVFEFKDRDPSDLKRGIRKLEKAKKLADKEEYPQLRGRILYYMAGSRFFYELQKPPEETDLSIAETSMKEYLNYYSNRGKKPPFEASIEKMLMQIDKQTEQNNESNTDSPARNNKSASG